MKRSTIGTTLAAGALALSLALVGCGGSNSSTTETTETTEQTAETTEQTAEETPTYPEEVTTEEQVQSAEGEQNAPEEQVEVKAEDKQAEITVSDEDAAKIAELEQTKKMGNFEDWDDWYEYYYSDMNSWTVAFQGATSNGFDLYYAGNAAGTEATLFIVDSDTGAYWSYAGNVVDLDNGNFAIVDDYSGRSVYFHTNFSDYNGNVYISLDMYGSTVDGVFSPCPLSTVLNIMDAVEDYGYSLNYF